MQNNLLTICGLSSVRALADSAPDLIERLFFDENNAPLFGEACRTLARNHKTYRLVASDELKKISDSAHHQGAAAVIHEPSALRLSELSPVGLGASVRPPTPRPPYRLVNHMLCLHDVLNPHNVGAILRTAAFFGVSQLILSRASYAAAMTSAAWRVAEGGLSHVKLFAYDDEQDFFAWMKLNLVSAIAAVKPGKGTQRTLREFIADTKNPQTIVVCLGNEENGLPQPFIEACGKRFSIAGSGKIESLNVSVVAALCLEKISESARSR